MQSLFGRTHIHQYKQYANELHHNLTECLWIIQKQIAYGPCNTTTVLFCGIATFCGRSRLSFGYQYNTAQKG
jgi:hypothetical protein